MAVDVDILKRPRKRYRVDVVLSAIHTPKSFSHTDGDIGEGHLVDRTSMVIPRVGPDRRALKNESLYFYAGDSYISGGAGATGHVWKAFYLGTNTPNDSVDWTGGTDVSGLFISPHPTAGAGNAATAQFTPNQKGHYRIECHLANQPAGGDNVNEPVGYGIRFVRVMDSVLAGATLQQTEWDYITKNIKTLDFSGQIDSGGYSATISVYVPRGQTPILPVANQRVLVYLKQYFYNDDTDEWDEYTWRPGHGTTEYIWYTPNIVLEGLVQAGSVEYGYQNEVLTFRINGIQAVLEQTSLPTVIRTDDTAAEQTQTFFFDVASYEFLQSLATEEMPNVWLHRFETMTFSDPIIHLLQRHSNFTTFFDAAVWQKAEDVLPYQELQGGDLLSFINTLEKERYGQVFVNAQGMLEIGPDYDTRGTEYWATANKGIILDNELYLSAFVQEADPNRIGQVRVQTIDWREQLPLNIQPRPGDDHMPSYSRVVKEYKWPKVPGPGTNMDIYGVPIYDGQTLADFTAKLWKKMNKRFPSIQTQHRLAPLLDLGHLIGIKLQPRSGFVNWTDTTVFITGVSFNISPDPTKPSFDITYTTSMLVDASAPWVDPEPPIANFTMHGTREKLADGTEKRFLFATSTAREGDAEINYRSFVADVTGVVKIGNRVGFAFDEGTSVVNITHNVFDANGNSDTLTRSIDLSALPETAYSFSETVWVASAAGHHVTPNGGQEWREDATLTTPINIGPTASVWATEDSNYGFWGTDAGDVWMSQDLGITAIKATGTPTGVRASAMWGSGSTFPGVFVGYANGKLYEVAYDKTSNTLKAAEVTSYADQMGNLGDIVFVYQTQGLIFVGAGDFLVSGTRTSWVKIARFAGIMRSGAARSSNTVSAVPGDSAYTILFSFVFAHGGIDVWLQGRVKYGERGIQWITENIIPSVGAHGTATAVGALTPGEDAVLAAFENANQPYLLPHVLDTAPGPAAPISSATPIFVGSIKALEYGLDGRDHAFSGDSTAVRKNLDPNAYEINEQGERQGTTSNLWLPFHDTNAEVRAIYVTKPRVAEPIPPPPTPQGRMIYIFAQPTAADPTPIVITWSPQTTPVKRYERIDQWLDSEASSGPPRATEGFHRYGSSISARDTSGTLVDLPPGFTSISLFATGFPPTEGTTATKGTWFQRIPAGAASTYNSWPYNQTLANITSAWVIKQDENGVSRVFGTFGGLKGNSNPLANATTVAWHLRPEGVNHVTYENDPGITWSMGLARRNYGPVSFLRGWGLAHYNYPDYDLSYLYQPFDEVTGDLMLGYHGGQNEIITFEPEAGTALSNEYFLFQGVLYYWPDDNEHPKHFTALAEMTAVTGLKSYVVSQESFDTHWIITNPGATTWAIHKRDTTNPANFIKVLDGEDAALIPSFHEYLNDRYGAGWKPTGIMCTTNLTSECAFLVSTGLGAPNDVYRLMLVRSDNTWADISGNLWDGFENAPAVLASKSTPILGLRHVLQEEYDPLQIEADNPSPPEPIVMPSALSQAIADEYPFLYYRFDEASGLTVVDASGNGRDATYSASGISYEQPALGDDGFAIALDGVTSNINLGSLLSGLGAPFTIIWLINKTAHASGNRYFFDSGSDPRFLIFFTPTQIWWSNNSSQAAFGNFTSGAKTMVAVTVSGTAAKCYINGSLLGTVTVSSSLGPTTRIGSSWDAGANTAATVDEFAFFSKVLSDAVILDLAQKAGLA